MLTVTLSVIGGLTIGVALGWLATEFGKKLDLWLDERWEKQSDRISRQRAARIGIRQDMDKHPVDLGEHWR